MRSERGSATVLVLGFCLVLGLLAALLAALAAAAVARHRAASAADLAALAAADRALDGPGPACAAARWVAAAQGAELAACTLVGEQAWVTAVVRPAGGLARFGSARSRAGAGPSGSQTTIGGAQSRQRPVRAAPA